MSGEDPCSDELSAAVAAFTQRGTVEPGLDVEGDALLQLRKACRILDGIRALRDIDRHHMLVVEGSFAALERTVQFYVVERELAEVDDLMSHEDANDPSTTSVWCRSMSRNARMPSRMRHAFRSWRSASPSTSSPGSTVPR